jgi:hypothetical protein
MKGSTNGHLYGGLGSMGDFDDVYSLRCGDINNMQWENLHQWGNCLGAQAWSLRLSATQDENESNGGVWGGVWMAPNTTAPTPTP